MAFFYVDDQLHGHPKPRKAGLDAMGLWAMAGSHSTGYKANGFVPAYYVASWPKGKQLAAKLVDAGMWHVNEPGLECDCVPDGADLTEPGWRYHDWLDINKGADEIEKERERARVRQRNLRARRREAQDKDGDK